MESSLNWDLGFDPISSIEDDFPDSSPELEPFGEIFNNDDLESLLASFETPSSIEDEDASPNPDEAFVGLTLEDNKVEGSSSPSSSENDENVVQNEVFTEPQRVQNTALDDHDYLSSDSHIKVFVPQPSEVSTEKVKPVKFIPILPQKSHNKIRILLKSPPDSKVQLLEVGEDCLDSGSCEAEENHYERKYPRLILSDEEKKMYEKDGIELPSHYPLTKEEETTLKRIRRKIRNKKSAQMSRKRKRDYLGDIETKAEESEAENKRLKRRISLLEAQNQTLMTQLRRMQQLVVEATKSEGVRGVKASATTLMVVVLSAALFALPGLKDQYGGKPKMEDALIGQSKGRVIGPGQSRSLLQHLSHNIQPDVLHESLNKATIRELADRLLAFGSQFADGDEEKESKKNITVVNKIRRASVSEFQDQ